MGPVFILIWKVIVQNTHGDKSFSDTDDGSRLQLSRIIDFCKRSGTNIEILDKVFVHIGTIADSEMLVTDWPVIMQDYIIFEASTILVPKSDAHLFKELILHLQKNLAEYRHLDAQNIFAIRLIGFHNIHDYFLFDWQIGKLGEQ